MLSKKSKSELKIFTFLSLLVMSVTFLRFGPSAMALEAQVKNHLGSPAIFIDGQPCVPMIFMGRSFIMDEKGNMSTEGWESQLSHQIRLAAKAGIHIHSVDMPFIMPLSFDKESADYSAIDKIVKVILEADPEALLLARFDIVAPESWATQHSEQAMVYSDGQKRKGISIASKLWRQEIFKNLRTYIRYCEEKYGDRILGYHPCGQNTGEWFYYNSWLPVHSGFEEPMRRGFAEWAKNKYRTVGKLRKAWIKNDVTFDTIKVPTLQERKKAANGLFRDPVGERFVIDFNEYLQAAMVEVLEKMAGIIKEQTGGKKLVCMFYGYCFSLSRMSNGLPASGHLALGRLLRCSDIDILCAPIDYVDRQSGGSAPFMTSVDSIRDAGKLWLNEDDTRTYLSKSDCDDSYPEHRRVDTLKGTIQIHQHNFAHLLPRRLGCWYMDLFGREWLNSVEIWDNIARLKKIYEQQFCRPAVWKPQVAVIVDERSPFYLAANRTLTGPLLTNFRKEFYRMGTGFRMNLLSDVLSGQLELPKVTLFLGCLHFTDKERKQLNRALKGKTAVWFYGSGYLDDKEGSVLNMEKLTGFCFTENSKGGTAAITFDVDNPLVNGLVETTYAPEIYDTEINFCPLWSVDNKKQVTPLAHFSDGTIAAAMIDTGMLKSIYIGTAGCPAQVLRNILLESGVHIYIDSNDVLLTDGHFLSLTASTAGTKKIYLHKGTVLQDIYTGEVSRPIDSTVQLDFESGQTRQWFIAEP